LHPHPHLPILSQLFHLGLNVRTYTHTYTPFLLELPPYPSQSRFNFHFLPARCLFFVLVRVSYLLTYDCVYLLSVSLSLCFSFLTTTTTRHTRHIIYHILSFSLCFFFLAMRLVLVLDLYTLHTIKMYSLQLHVERFFLAVCASPQKLLFCSGSTISLLALASPRFRILYPYSIFKRTAHVQLHVHCATV